MSAPKPVWAVLLGALALAAVYGEIVDSPFTWIYVVITVVLAGVVTLIHRAVQLPRPVLWGLLG